jgi:tetratricopeptide (TPR) repeat protein
MAATAHATLPEWMQHVVGASSVERALYRAMALPGVQALYPRPPKESQGELARLIAGTPKDAELYALRARSDEGALDFAAAEADWKSYVAHAKEPVDARLALADFYRRRMMVPQEIGTLTEVGSAAPVAAERFVDPSRQRSWIAFDRMLALEADQGLPAAQTNATFAAFLARYPEQPAVYAQVLTWDLAQKDWAGAEALIARYQRAFPKDAVFAIRAQALLDYRRGDIESALAVYDKAFEPLWPAELVQSYYGLLDATHRQRTFVADARAKLAQHPDGPEAMNALARIFYYDQQAGRLDRAEQTIDAFRIARETRQGAWTANDLATLAALTHETHNYAEAARYDYALASTTGSLPSGEPAAQAGLSGLVDVLLTAPDQAIALGAGNLSMYRDIATLDQGPGYWNGILSLWLNGSSPQTEYQAETAKAQSYFHRAKAAELLAQLDARFPAAPRRAELHAQLIRTYAQYGEPEAVIAAGKEFLASFPAAANRVEIGGLMADAYSRQQKYADEFALYDSLLTELAAKTDGLPLTAGKMAQPGAAINFDRPVRVVNPDAETPAGDAAATRPASAMKSASYELTAYAPVTPLVPEASEYAQILDRYLGRLVAEKQVPQALTVLKRELDRSPNDPLLYERLASFLEQNNLSQQQEATYRLAIAKFQQPGWYDKLARLYLRERNREAYAAVTRQVTDIFAGTELDAWFRQVGNLAQFNALNQPAVGPQLAVQLNLYAQKRFPHDLVFTRNLLRAYESKPTVNAAAYEDLLRHHWWDADDLRGEFFAYLAKTGKLRAEQAQLEAMVDRSPAASRELAEVDVWGSHFEQAAPLLGTVAELYPADATTGDQAISLYRSLAYLDASGKDTARAVGFERALIAAAPGDADRLATLGDLYAEATATGGEDIAAAAPGWRRIPELHPGTPAGYLTAATIFWDYFQFDDALREIEAARAKFRQPGLFGYEAGAIAENRRDMATAVAEYTAEATAPPGNAYFVDSLNAALGAFFRPPSDAADSDLQASVQSLFNPAEARGRLLQLAARKASAGLVDAATAKVVASAPTPVALTLRADVLVAEKRPAEIAPLLEAALSRAKTADEAAAIGDLARTHSQTPVYSEATLREVDVALPAGTVAKQYAATGSYALAAVYEHALARQIALSGDPVEKMQLSYVLSGELESRKDNAGAAKVVDAVYRANPRILGVVRATTDFYSRTNQPPRAIGTLLEAAKVATPELARGFTLEAAQKANDAGNTAQARTLAQGLLVQTPYDAQVLGIIAASYARANEDAGLKAFYTAQLAQVKAANLSAEERKADTALLRRGLIPALTRGKDYEGAVAQYIALLSAYPEDASTTQEAALYALRYGRQAQLLGFLQTTVKQSPQDSRYAVLLAQVDTTFEDLPGAVAAYSQAIAIRKDRADLYTARVDLELRLRLTDAAMTERAAEDFNRLYVLSYKDPVWMVKLAELRARQQRPADAVKALEAAYITGQTPSPENQFKVADQLAKWNLLSEARTYAERGVAQAGMGLLGGSNGGGATSYARVMARLGKPDEALSKLVSAYRAAAVDVPLPSGMAAQYVQAGVSASDIARDTRSYNETRRQTARQQLALAVNAIGQVVETYDTPEQKAAYAATLEKLHATNAPLALQAASAAGLAEVEAEWRKQRMLTGPIATPDEANVSAYRSLERLRLQFTELGNTLESYAARLKAEARNLVLQDAAQAYRDAGDEADEMRVTRPLVLAQDTVLRDRFLDLLLRHDRAALLALAASKDDSLADAAANYAVAHATQAQAMGAIAGRSRGMPAVWAPAMTSLVLTNFASPATSGATNTGYFQHALRYDDTIGQRLTTPANPDRELTGKTWFYYAGRFGLFLNTVQKTPALPDAENFLAAEKEYAPPSPAVYLHLARNYADAGNMASAATEYRHALEIAPNNPAVHDEFAVVLYRGNHHDEALAEWRAALSLFAQRQSGEEFFAAFQSVMLHAGQRRLAAVLKPETDAVLKPYFARNGNYRSNELLEAIYKATPTSDEGMAWVLEAAGYGADPTLILEDLRRAQWIDDREKETLLLRQIELTRNKPKGESDSSPQGAMGYQFDLVELYLDTNELAKANALLRSMPTYATRSADMYKIILATREGRLEALLTAWRRQPETTPSKTDLDSAMYRLRKPAVDYAPNSAAIRPLEEFIFETRQLNHELQPTDFLALAQTRIETNDLPGALEVLHRLALRQPSTYENGPIDFSGEAESHYAFGPAGIAWHGPEGEPEPHVNTDYAAALLEKTQHYAEAIPFLESLTQAEPWSAEFKLRLAEARMKTGDAGGAATFLRAIAGDAAVPYALRVSAAKDLAALASGGDASGLGSAELSLLAASRSPAAALARKPYFSVARVAAATGVSVKPDRAALLREAVAIDPSGPEAQRARVDLLLAQTAADSASMTLALFESVTNAPSTNNRSDMAEADDVEAASDAESGPMPAADDPSDAAEQSVRAAPSFSFALAQTLDRHAQIRLAVLLASAYQRTQNPGQSLAYDQLAVNIDAKNAKPDTVVVKRLTDYKAALALEKKNALRRPLIHGDLDQVNQVRPRLTLADVARAEAP